MNISIQENIESNLKKMGELPNCPVAKLKKIIETYSSNSVALNLRFKSSCVYGQFDEKIDEFLKLVENYDSATTSREFVSYDIFINAQASIALLNLYRTNSFNSRVNNSITDRNLLVCILFLFAFNLFSNPLLEGRISADISNYFQRPHDQDAPLQVISGPFVALPDILNYFHGAGILNGEAEFYNRIQKAIENSGLEEGIVNSLLTQTIPKHDLIIPQNDGARVIQAVYNLIFVHPILAKLKKIRSILIAIAIGLVLSGAIATVAWAALTSITILQFIPFITLGITALIIIGKIIKLSCDITCDINGKEQEV